MIKISFLIFSIIALNTELYAQEIIYVGIEKEIITDRRFMRSKKYIFTSENIVIDSKAGKYYFTPKIKGEIKVKIYKNRRLCKTISYCVIPISDYEIDVINRFFYLFNDKPGFRSKTLDALKIKYNLVNYKIKVIGKKSESFDYKDTVTFRQSAWKMCKDDTIVLSNFVIKYNNYFDTIGTNYYKRQIKKLKWNPGLWEGIWQPFPRDSTICLKQYKDSIP